MKHTVDARGLTCPLPVVNTKNEIERMKEGESVDVLVDNEIAVQNLSKFAGVRGYDFSHEKKNDMNYRVTITVGKTDGKAEEGLTDSLAVGGVTNMYDIVRIISEASKIIRP